MRILSLLAVCCLLACDDDGAGEVEADAAVDAELDAAPEPSPSSLEARDGRLFDGAGRELLLRGINARVEGLFDVTFDDGRLPLEHIPAFGGEDCRFLAEQLGFNLLRLPINWSALEPARGDYAQPYLDRILALADDCHAHGVGVIVDLHQDAWSKEIGEDGAPLWAIVPPPTELLGGPLEDLEARRLSAQVINAFRSFFDDAEDLQEAYAEMCAHLAGAIADHPGVLGLELMNEPISFDDRKLAVFHERVGRAVREVAPDLTLFFEPDAIRNLQDARAVAVPYPLTDAVYSPHIYTHIFSAPRDGWASEDPEVLRPPVEAAVEEAEAHGAPLFIGEFGNDPKTPRGRKWIAEELALFDTHRASWALWVYEESSQGAWGLYEVDEEEQRAELREPIADLIARPFPQAVDGRITAIDWQPDTATLGVSLSDAGPGEHRFSAPLRTWPEAPTATCDGAPVDLRYAPGRVWLRCSGGEVVLSPGNP